MSATVKAEASRCLGFYCRFYPVMYEFGSRRLRRIETQAFIGAAYLVARICSSLDELRSSK